MLSKDSENFDEDSECESDEELHSLQPKLSYYCCPCFSKHRRKDHFSDNCDNGDLNEGEYFIEKLAIRRIHIEDFNENLPKVEKTRSKKDKKKEEKLLKLTKINQDEEITEDNKKRKKKDKNKEKIDTKKKNKTDPKTPTYRAKELLKIKPNKDNETKESVKKTVNISIKGRQFEKKSSKTEVIPDLTESGENKELKILYYKTDEDSQEKLTENNRKSFNKVDDNQDAIIGAHPSDTRPTKLNWKIVVKRHKDNK